MLIKYRELHHIHVISGLYFVLIHILCAHDDYSHLNNQEVNTIIECVIIYIC